MSAHPIQVPLSLPLGDVRGNKTLRVLMPRTRGECVGGQRPCIHVQCRHHIVGEIARHPDFDAALEAYEKKAAADCDPELGHDTCALDVADRGTHSAPEVASQLGISKQRVHQICDEAGFYARRFGIKEKAEVRSLLETAEVMRDR
jgi:hypothetical protein